MRAAGRAKRTVAERLSIVELLARRTGCDPLTATWRDLAAFLAAFESPGTIETYQSHLRAFYGWMVRIGRRTDDPTALLGKPPSIRRLPRPITTDELAALLSASMYARTRVMVCLAAYAGLRVHEIAKLRGADYNPDELLLRVVGKGGHESALAVHPLVAAAVAGAGLHGGGWWFPAPAGKPRPVTPNTVSTTISRTMRRAGISGTAHSLRHWFLTTQLRKGANVRVVQENARHARLSSTQIYTEVDSDERREAVLLLPVPLHVVRRRAGIAG